MLKRVIIDKNSYNNWIRRNPLGINTDNVSIVEDIEAAGFDFLTSNIQRYVGFCKENKIFCMSFAKEMRPMKNAFAVEDKSLRSMHDTPAQTPGQKMVLDALLQLLGKTA